METVFRTKTFTVRYNENLNALESYFHCRPVPCFTLSALRDILTFQEWYRKNYNKELAGKVKYWIVRSKSNKVFNLGGDLFYFQKYARERNREKISVYAKLCVDCIFNHYSKGNTPIITISLLEGDAYGGGFETALSSDVIIMEEQVRAGFPEIRMNLFPGMGAFSIISRKLNKNRALEIISGGQVYKARVLKEMGLADVVVPMNQGERAVTDFIEKTNKRFLGYESCYNSYRLIGSGRNNNDIYDEMMNISGIWVNAVLNLSDKDLAKIDGIIERQTGKFGKIFIKYMRAIQGDFALYANKPGSNDEIQEKVAVG